MGSGTASDGPLSQVYEAQAQAIVRLFKKKSLQNLRTSCRRMGVTTEPLAFAMSKAFARLYAETPKGFLIN